MKTGGSDTLLWRGEEAAAASPLPPLSAAVGDVSGERQREREFGCPHEVPILCSFIATPTPAPPNCGDAVRICRRAPPGPFGGGLTGLGGPKNRSFFLSPSKVFHLGDAGRVEGPLFLFLSSFLLTSCNNIWCAQNCPAVSFGLGKGGGGREGTKSRYCEGKPLPPLW